jgi:hypothetical protein
MLGVVIAENENNVWTLSRGQSGDGDENGSTKAEEEFHDGFRIVRDAGSTRIKTTLGSSRTFKN